MVLSCRVCCGRRQPITVVRKVNGDVAVMTGGPKKITIDTLRVKKRANKVETVVHNLEVDIAACTRVWRSAPVGIQASRIPRTHTAHQARVCAWTMKCIS